MGQAHWATLVLTAHPGAGRGVSDVLPSLLPFTMAPKEWWERPPPREGGTHTICYARAPSITSTLEKEGLRESERSVVLFDGDPGVHCSDSNHCLSQWKRWEKSNPSLPASAWLQTIQVL